MYLPNDDLAILVVGLGNLRSASFARHTWDFLRVDFPIKFLQLKIQSDLKLCLAGLSIRFFTKCL